MIFSFTSASRVPPIVKLQTFQFSRDSFGNITVLVKHDGTFHQSEYFWPLDGFTQWHGDPGNLITSNLYPDLSGIMWAFHVLEEFHSFPVPFLSSVTSLLPGQHAADFLHWEKKGKQFLKMFWFSPQFPKINMWAAGIWSPVIVLCHSFVDSWLQKAPANLQWELERARVGVRKQTVW
jgi:hypothetical protein